MDNVFFLAAQRTRRGFAHRAAACALAAIGSMVTSIPASADQNEGHHERSGGAGKRAPTVLATPPFFLETNQTGACALVNLGAVAREVTVTYHTEETQPDGTPVPDAVTTVTIEPNQERALRFGFGMSRSLTPVPAFCKFQSTDTSLLRGGGYAASDSIIQRPARAVAAE
jgi:hypothetical protein